MLISFNLHVQIEYLCGFYLTMDPYIMSLITYMYTSNRSIQNAFHLTTN